MTPEEERALTALAVDLRFRAGRAIRARARRLADRLVVRWCRLSGSHFVESWTNDWGYVGSHSGCESCTWCVECRQLLGRDVIPDPRA